MDRTDIARLSKAQQDLESSAFIMGRLEKHFRETAERMKRMLNEYEEVLTRDLRGSRRGNMDQRTTKK